MILTLDTGSFGSTPTAITKLREHFQHLSERRPDTFIRYVYPKLLLEARKSLAAFLHAPPQTIAFVTNATTGINTVLRGLEYEAGDHILYFDFIYGACGNTVEYVAESTAATALRVEVSLPLTDDALETSMRAAIAGVASGRVRVAVFDTVVSVPGMVLPYERLVRVCRELGVLSLIDGAHGVGFLDLDLGALDPDFFTSNCHKWLYAPRGCAVLYAPARNQALLRSTLPTSWGYAPPACAYVPLPPAADSDAWAGSFAFVGTTDASPYLCVPGVLRLREWLGGEERIREYTYSIAHAGAEIFRKRLGTEIMYVGSETGMYNIRLPLAEEEVPVDVRGKVEAWLTGQMDSLGTYVTLLKYKGAWWFRVSGQIYLEESDFVKGAELMESLVAKVKSGEWLV